MLTREMAAALVPPERLENLRPNFAPGQSILVAARGFTPVLRFALEEARLRQGVCTSSMSNNSPSICPARWQTRSARVGRQIARRRKSCTGCLTWLKTVESKCCRLCRERKPGRDHH